MNNVKTPIQSAPLSPFAKSPGAKPASDLSQLSDAELLSLAADGELPASDHGHWHRATAAGDAHSQWQSHLFAGDAIRSQASRARGTRSRDDWMSGLRARLASECSAPVHSAGVMASASVMPAASTPVALVPAAANDRFWKLVAGASVFTSVGAMAFALTVGMGARQDGPQLAVAPGTATQAMGQPSRQLATTGTTQAVLVSAGDQMMIRDPRLMERIAQHRQFGSNGIHASTAFLRNATFESSRCQGASALNSDC